MFYTGSASNFSSYTISGCSVKLEWNLKNASQYAIDITSQNISSSFLVHTTTSEHTFVFVAERQGVYYTLKWAPVYYIDNKRHRGNTSEEHTVYIAKGKVESCKAEFGILIYMSVLFRRWIRLFQFKTMM